MGLVQIIGWSIWEKEGKRLGPAFFDNSSRWAYFVDPEKGTAQPMKAGQHVICKDDD